MTVPGLTWATGSGAAAVVRLDVLAVGVDARALSTFAYGAKTRRIPTRSREAEAKPFHHQQAFIRFGRTARRRAHGQESPQRVSAGERRSTTPACP